METNIYKISAPVGRKLRFAFVSDLHDAENAPIVDAIKRSDIDAVLIGGDLIHDERLYGRGGEFLRISSSIAPTFCSIGNHERKFQGDILDFITSNGGVPLDDTYAVFEGVAIGGLSSGCSGEKSHGLFKKTPPPSTGWLSAFCRYDGFKLLLCHHPEYYESYLKALPIELILSGHAHGGQWRALGRGLLAPGQGLFPRYTSGMYDGRFIVGRGIGNKTKIPRINNAPELIMIELG